MGNNDFKYHSISKVKSRDLLSVYICFQNCILVVKCVTPRSNATCYEPVYTIIDDLVILESAATIISS